MTSSQATSPSRRKTPPRSRWAWLATVFALILALPLLPGAFEAARAATPELLLGRPAAGEFQPILANGFLVWQQNTRKSPNHYDVFARPAEGGSRFKVNPPKMNGANGGLEGSLLVYQQFAGSRSELKFFDLVNRVRSNPPRGVNTPQWEYWPSMSGQWLLFGRLTNSGARAIILFDLTTGDPRRLARVRGSGTFLAPGQVNGEFATWHRCRSSTSCDVVRYHIPDRTKETIPNPAARQYAPSVTPDGTLYFARSRARCGSGVRLVTLPLGGGEAVLTRIPSGSDIGATHTNIDGDGMATTTYDQFVCGRAAASDAWMVTEDTSPTLTVTLSGNGSGKVTSNPAGINCGNDCTETYDRGTGVTLTAEPTGGSSFGGWGGACTGTSPTCTLTMDRARTVTATFTNNPVLSVELSGTGTGAVTSSPAGINCGTDCTEPYQPGTSVTLTAKPSGDSTFDGWGGACSGTGSCTVTMNGARSVTATFTPPAPVDLSVIVDGSGSGSVTSSPAGITCGGDCTETYPIGKVVTLSASPGVGSTLEAWGGACLGTDPNDTCSVTMDANKSVSATFALVP